ncbi:PadR family transcriptional regulator [Halorubrum salinum]|uniref:PadR family transcriptional regulator n=1 Tax=Halorubrum salinum TaxID=767517 RepID=UPI0021134DE1|nr:PadR family transcriptional regulator [Halorubrum salinum]
MSSATRGDGDDVELSGPGSVADLTAFQRDILRLLARENHQKGLSIKGKLEAYYGTKVHHGRLYPNLDTLVDRELVEKSKRDERTNDYALTTRGQRALKRHDQWIDGGGA